MFKSLSNAAAEAFAANFSVDQIELMLEALERAASRHESMARFRPGVARRHDQKAEAMRKLHTQLLKIKAEKQHGRTVD